MSMTAANDTRIPLFSDDATLYDYVHSSPPFYFSSRPTVFDFMSDEVMSLAAPVVAYWSYSLMFHVLDSIDYPWINKYRIHESAEVKKRNLVSRTSCLAWVLLQHVMQTVLGVLWLESSEEPPSFLTDVTKIRIYVLSCSELLLGEATALRFLRAYGPASIWFVYWWAIPALQLLFAMFCIDTWQYFWHRAFHVNKFLYRNFHSWHHRLYVPYAYGALYNHPLEGLILDTVGTVIAQTLSMMSTRQASVLFAFATLKTIDDHCGYRLPVDPLQFFFRNNADYHDIHHQIVGIKSNFAQPFFVHWDVILGTRMTREDLEQRQRRTKQKTS